MDTEHLLCIPAEYIEAARENYQTAVKSSIVDLMFDTDDGLAILAANNVVRIKFPPPVPTQVLSPQILKGTSTPDKFHSQILDVFDCHFSTQQGCIQMDDLQNGMEIATAGEGNFLYAPIYPASVPDLCMKSEKTILMASTHYLKSAQRYYIELDIRDMLLVDLVMEDLQFPAELDDYKECQDMHLTDATDQLKSDWVLKVGILLAPYLHRVAI